VDELESVRARLFASEASRDSERGSLVAQIICMDRILRLDICKGNESVDVLSDVLTANTLFLSSLTPSSSSKSVKKEPEQEQSKDPEEDLGVGLLTNESLVKVKRSSSNSNSKLANEVKDDHSTSESLLSNLSVGIAKAQNHLDAIVSTLRTNFLPQDGVDGNGKVRAKLLIRMRRTVWK